MKVKVHYLLSKNNKIGSRFIAWGTKHLTPEIKDTPSHIAVLINERWVHESTLETGVRVISYKKWLEINKEVAKVRCAQEYREYNEIKEIYRSIQNKDYDWLGVLYLGIHVCLNKFFGKKLPKTNKWQKDNKYFCSEAAEKLTGIPSTGMETPTQFLRKLLPWHK